jgi:hypothetical protein
MPAVYHQRKEKARRDNSELTESYWQAGEHRHGILVHHIQRKIMTPRTHYYGRPVPWLKLGPGNRAGAAEVEVDGVGECSRVGNIDAPGLSSYRQESYD